MRSLRSVDVSRRCFGRASAGAGSVRRFPYRWSMYRRTRMMSPSRNPMLRSTSGPMSSSRLSSIESRSNAVAYRVQLSTSTPAARKKSNQSKLAPGLLREPRRRCAGSDSRLGRAPSESRRTNFFPVTSSRNSRSGRDIFSTATSITIPFTLCRRSTPFRTPSSSASTLYCPVRSNQVRTRIGFGFRPRARTLESRSSSAPERAARPLPVLPPLLLRASPRGCPRWMELIRCIISYPEPGVGAAGACGIRCVGESSASCSTGST